MSAIVKAVRLDDRTVNGATATSIISLDYSSSLIDDREDTLTQPNQHLRIGDFISQYLVAYQISFVVYRIYLVDDFNSHGVYYNLCESWLIAVIERAFYWIPSHFVCLSCRSTFSIRNCFSWSKRERAGNEPHEDTMRITQRRACFEKLNRFILWSITLDLSAWNGIKKKVSDTL